MNRVFRIITVAVAVFGIVLLAWDQVAWAKPPATAADQSSLAQKDKEKCKDKDKDKEKKCGSVKPPPGSLIIPDTGGVFSVGGICTIEIEYKADGLFDEVFLEVPVEKSSEIPFPEEDGEIHLPGCHVLHFKSNQLVDEVSPSDGSWTICFAARPNKTMTIYYYPDKPASDKPTWIPLETTVEDQSACAPANFTGVYAPASK